MLTSMFYFNYYKPYLIKEDEPVAPANSPKKIFSPSSSAEKKSLLLNKAYKSDIVNYVGDLSKKVINFKDASRTVAQSFEDFEKNNSRKGLVSAKIWLSEDLSSFTQAYNSSIKFASSQEHSLKLRNFAIEQDYYIRQNEEDLKSLGITVNNDGTLSYDETNIKDMKASELRKAIENTCAVFGDIYEHSVELMTHPLSSHMNFKGLGYYYNYKLGTVQDDTFRIVKSGMLVDIAV